ncbi:hypothetical protein [Luteimonas terricola]|uniref:Uncharacterized protein n=1 Tax=Luteimonas terricola TaxID=645597 RepID=A0ABQ2EHZ3_9GAMM|nr:hypothetical protein [Luteimonas terricola]GGK08882.1 hypothetical protein GCM10011394_17910 [Luteimonas terricola]
MASWGESRVIGALTVVPLVDSHPWQAADADQPILSLLVINVEAARDAYRAAFELVQNLERQYVGQPYGMWLALAIEGSSAVAPNAMALH